MASGATFLQAVVATWLADTEPVVGLTVVIPGSPWFNEEPEQYSTPLGVIYHGGERPNYTTQNPEYEIAGCDFVVVAPGCAAAEALAARVKAVFDPDPGSGINARIAVTDATVGYFLRQNYAVEKTKQRDPNDVPIYRVTLSYSAWIGYSLPTKESG